MNESKFFDFVSELKINTPKFVHQMSDEQQPGKYRFSLSGDIPKENVHWGLGQSTFAARILYIFGALDENNINHISNYIHTFLHSDGSYYDDYISRTTFFKRLLLSIKYHNTEFLFNSLNKRAETRQSKAALINLGITSEDYIGFDLTRIDIKEYFSRFNWCRPWGAGSHINHLIFFTKYSKLLSDAEKDNIYKNIENNLTRIWQSDGFYHSDCQPSPNEKIGGMMKLMMGLGLIGREGLWIKNSFIDYALDQTSAFDACENFNTLYVLYCVTRHTDYRKEEIIQYALDQTDNWMDYYHSQYNAFSFYPRMAGKSYYGANITKGLAEPDLHGTAMFVWGLLIVAEISGCNDRLNLVNPVL